MGKSQLGPRNFVNNKGVPDPIFTSPSSREAIKSNKNVKQINSANRPGNIRVVGKGSHPEGRTAQERFLSNLPLLSTSKWKVYVF